MTTSDFSYGEKVALHDINLHIKPGQLVALVGASGSGKTTLANLLLRFYDPQRGAVRIGGVDIRDVSTRDLRNQIAVVTQETILFNDTIRRNIELGRPGATNDEIIAAARHAYAYDFIMEKPDGFDTVIGEKGVTLSGGQRQRLAIARAVLKNAPILDPRRGHQRARHRIRTRRAGRAGRIDERPHDDLHRAPALDDFARRRDCGAGSGPHRRNRQARGIGQARRRLSKTLRDAVPIVIGAQIHQMRNDLFAGGTFITSIAKWFCHAGLMQRGGVRLTV